MSQHGDQDGKSKTASAADKQHYPPIDKEDHEPPDAPGLPTNEEIAERAYHLWVERCRQPDSAQENWLEAERELHEAALSRRLTQISHERGGSVQS